MPQIPLSTSLPLPRGWPRRVRSAVIQVISLASTSLALTQGWASEGMNPELRQQSDGDRLQQEIRLLREEIRIKDSRMEQLEAHRRPHYPPTARLAILEFRAARGWSLAQTARVFLVRLKPTTRSPSPTRKPPLFSNSHSRCCNLELRNRPEWPA